MTTSPIPIDGHRAIAIITCILIAGIALAHDLERHDEPVCDIWAVEPGNAVQEGC